MLEGWFVFVCKFFYEMLFSDVVYILEFSLIKICDDLWEFFDSDFYGDVIEELFEDVCNGIIVKMMLVNVVDVFEDMDIDDLVEILLSLLDEVL